MCLFRQCGPVHRAAIGYTLIVNVPYHVCRIHGHTRHSLLSSWTLHPHACTDNPYCCIHQIFGKNNKLAFSTCHTHAKIHNRPLFCTNVATNAYKQWFFLHEHDEKDSEHLEHKPHSDKTHKEQIYSLCVYISVCWRECVCTSQTYYPFQEKATALLQVACREHLQFQI